jgi:hypothetical protein
MALDDRLPEVKAIAINLLEALAENPDGCV